VQINDDFCGMDVNTPLGGSMPIEAAPVLSYNNELLTSVAATSTHDYTVVFLGTVNGHLKKVSLIKHRFYLSLTSICGSL
jgi:plexin A